MNVAVVIATYNEKENIEKLITTLEEEVFPKIKNHQMQIVVADDTSPDGTGEIVRRLMKKYKNLDINEGPKKGLGAAYIRAMSYAIEHKKADAVMSMDADFSHDPLKVPEFVKKMEEGYDIVVGTRYSDGGSMPDEWPIQRKAFSVVGNLIVRAVTGRFKIHDWTGGYRLIKKEVFLHEREKVRGFTGYHFQVAFLYKSVLDGFTVGEVPFHFPDRRFGRSKIAPGLYIVNLLWYVFNERLHEIVFGSFGKFFAVGLTGLAINLITYELLATHTRMNLIYANTIGAELAIFSNYNLNNIWTFSHRRTKTVSQYFAKMLMFFLTSNIGVWIFQNGIIGLGEYFYGRKYHLVYFVIGTALLLVWNFTIYSKVIWKEKK